MTIYQHAYEQARSLRSGSVTSDRPDGCQDKATGLASTSCPNDRSPPGIEAQSGPRFGREMDLDPMCMHDVVQLEGPYDHPFPVRQGYPAERSAVRALGMEYMDATSGE